MPGFPLDLAASGTNKFIKEGAILVQSIDDLPVPSEIESKSRNSSNYFRHLDNNFLQQITNDMRSKIVIESLSATPVSIETLVITTELPIRVIHTIILELELAGKVIQHPGNDISLIFE